MSGNKYGEKKSDKGKLTKNDRNGLRMKNMARQQWNTDTNKFELHVRLTTLIM